MPYVDEHTKRRLHHDPPRTSGELTYLLQQVIGEYLEERVASQGTISYKDIAECLGALSGATIDFTDRVVIPYEHKARERNGDVWNLPHLMF